MNALYIIDLIGFFGPHILFLITLYLLYSRKHYLFVYIFACVLNGIINLILKGIIRQKRPDGDTDIFNKNKKYERIGSNNFGMPSGHSQYVVFSTIYIYLVLNNTNITLFYALVSLITMFQRVKYQNHFLKQVIVGALLGGSLAYCSYLFANKKIMGKLVAKKDDNALDTI